MDLGRIPSLILIVYLLGAVAELNSIRRRHCRDALKRRRGPRADHRRRPRVAQRSDTAAVSAAATAICTRIRIRSAKGEVVHTRNEHVQLVVGEISVARFTTIICTALCDGGIVVRVDRETAAAAATVLRHSIQRASNRVDANLSKRRRGNQTQKQTYQNHVSKG